MMLEEQGEGTATNSQFPADETDSENKTAYELQRKLMEYESDSEAGDQKSSMTKSFSVGDITLN